MDRAESEALNRDPGSRPPDLRAGPGPSDTKGQIHRQRAEDPQPDCVSVKSDRSREKPPDLRDGPGPPDTKSRDSSSGSAGTMLVMEKCLHRGRKRSGVWEEEQLSSCALCQDVLKDPVSTSCGHWFCRQCSSSYWDQSASSNQHPVKKLLSQLLPLSESVQSEDQAAGPPPLGPPE
ncbi:unnamed protein product, partial [Menidia menidia]